MTQIWSGHGIQAYTVYFLMGMSGPDRHGVV